MGGGVRKSRSSFCCLSLLDLSIWKRWTADSCLCLGLFCGLGFGSDWGFVVVSFVAAVCDLVLLCGLLSRFFSGLICGTGSGFFFSLTVFRWGTWELWSVHTSNWCSMIVFPRVLYSFR